MGFADMPEGAQVRGRRAYRRAEVTMPKQKVQELRRPGGPETRTIDARVCREQQTVDYVEVLQLRDHRLRVEIRSDSYASQSYSRIRRWDGSQWQFVHELGGGNRKTPVAMYVKDESKFREMFAADREELVELAGRILP